MEYTKEMIERLIDSHFNLFRRLNQINNKVAQPPATQRALRDARELNRYFADGDSAKIVQSDSNYKKTKQCLAYRDLVNKGKELGVIIPTEDEIMWMEKRFYTSIKPQEHSNFLCGLYSVFSKIKKI